LLQKKGSKRTKKVKNKIERKPVRKGFGAETFTTIITSSKSPGAGFLGRRERQEIGQRKREREYYRPRHFLLGVIRTARESEVA